MSTLIQEDDTDYVLDPNHKSVWITVGNISVYITRTDEGVVVDLYSKDREADDALGSTWALFSEAED